MRADFGKSEICRQAVIELIQQIECNREDQEILDRVYDQFTNIITEEMNRNIPFKDINTSRKRKKKWGHTRPFWNSDLTNLLKN